MTTTSLETLCRQVEQESAAATPGPWEAGHYDFQFTRVYGPESQMIADVPSKPATKSPDARFIATTRDFAPKAARALPDMAEALRGWMRFVEEELAAFDEPCDAKEENEMCPKCRNTGCIRLKIEATRAALAQFEQPKENA